MNSPHRTLPITVHVGDEETWHSWIVRLADTLHLDPFQTLHSIGYTSDYRRGRSELLGYGITADPDVLNTVAAITRNPPQSVAATMLDQYDGGPISLTGLDPAAPGNARKIGLREWVHLGSSTACPHCVAAANQWRLAWRLPWAAICTQHNVFHIANCPGCGEPFNAGRRRDGSLGPYSANTIATPGTCHNPRDKTKTPYPTLCGHPYNDLPATPCTQPDLIAAQHAINHLLTPQHRTAHNQWWNDLRAVTSTLLSHATTDLYTQLLPGLPQQTIDALTAHYQRRDDTANSRRNLTRQGRDGRGGPRIRTLTNTPNNPALTAAAQTVALAILNELNHLPPPLQQQPPQLPPALDTVTNNFRERRIGLVQHLRLRRGSNHLAEQVKARSGYNTLLTTAAPTTPHPDRRQEGGLKPRHIPRLCPWDDYLPVADLMRSTNTTDDYARSYLSLCIAKLLTGGTWLQAAQALRADPIKGRRNANAVTTRLAGIDAVTHIHQHAQNLYQQWLDQPDSQRINYRKLATKYGRKQHISRTAHQRLTAEAGITLQATEARRRNYAAWQWHTIALMPLAEWPGWDNCPNPNNAREIYRRWLANDLPRIHPDLPTLQSPR